MMPPNPYMASAVNQSIQAWYKEIKDIKLEEDETTDGVIGHFTALIWKDSRKVGIGATMKDNGYIYIVAKYSPAMVLGGEYLDDMQPGAEQEAQALQLALSMTN